LPRGTRFGSFVEYVDYEFSLDIEGQVSKRLSVIVSSVKPVGSGKRKAEDESAEVNPASNRALTR